MGPLWLVGWKCWLPLNDASGFYWVLGLGRGCSQWGMKGGKSIFSANATRPENAFGILLARMGDSPHHSTVLCTVHWEGHFFVGFIGFLQDVYCSWPLQGMVFVVLAAPPPCAAFLVFVASVRYICCFPSISYVFILRLRGVFLFFHSLFGSLKYLTKKYISILYYILRAIQRFHHLDWCCFCFSCHCCGFAGWVVRRAHRCASPPPQAIPLLCLLLLLVLLLDVNDDDDDYDDYDDYDDDDDDDDDDVSCSLWCQSPCSWLMLFL